MALRSCTNGNAASFQRRVVTGRTSHVKPWVRVRTAQLDRASVQDKAYSYVLTAQQKEAFKRDGFVHITGVVTDEELAQSIDEAYHKFMNGDIKVPGKDLKSEEASLLSVMHPRAHCQALQSNAIEKRFQDIACQLLDSNEVELDFDQILAKRPRSRDSGMPWHQDEAYWPNGSREACQSMTANVWLAVSDVPVESGCMRYVPGSHLEPALRPHEQAAGAPDAASLRARVGGDRAVLVPMKRGDVVIHHERVVHGSGPNMTNNWRCGYILNFKRSGCVVEERAVGYNSSSLNDVVAWKPKAGVTGVIGVAGAIAGTA